MITIDRGTLTGGCRAKACQSARNKRFGRDRKVIRLMDVLDLSPEQGHEQDQSEALDEGHTYLNDPTKQFTAAWGTC